MPLLTDEKLFKLLDSSVPDIIHGISGAFNIPVIRDGNFVDDRFGDGCGKQVWWNAGGYYMEVFTCGETYPSGATFYCSEECYCKLGSTTRVFISYSWREKALVDRMAAPFAWAGITFLRDVNEVGAFDDIEGFMNEAAAARFFVTVLSENYLRSRNCMYELVQIMKSDLNIRAVPLVVDARALSADAAELTQYWRGRSNDIRRAMDGLDANATASLREELAVTQDIIECLREFHAALSEIKIPPLEALVDDNFRGVVSMITRTVGQDAEAVKETVPCVTPGTDVAERGAPKHAQDAQDHATVFVSGCTAGGTGDSIAEELWAALRADSEFRADVIDSFHAFQAGPLDPARKFFICVLDDCFLRSLTHAWQAVAVNEAGGAKIIPIFLDSAIFKPLSEVPYIAHWQREAARLEGRDAERAAKIRDSIGKFIASQRVKKMPDLDAMRASGFADLKRIMRQWQSGSVRVSNLDLTHRRPNKRVQPTPEGAADANR